MDVRGWPLDRLMMLPDYCFGRRWDVGLSFYAIAEQSYFDQSVFPLPDLCVLWELAINVVDSLGDVGYLRLGLSDYLPTTEGQFNDVEPILYSYGADAYGPRRIYLNSYMHLSLRRLRLPVSANGRRVVGQLENTSGFTGVVQVVLIVSGVPTEIPEWLA